MIYKKDVKCLKKFYFFRNALYYKYFLLLFREKTAYQMGSSCYTFGVFQNFIPILA